MNNRDDFANRLQRLEQRDTQMISRSTSVDPATAQIHGQKDKGMRKWFAVKAVLFVGLALVSMRVGVVMMGVDLEERRVELANGTAKQWLGAVALRGAMVADPYLLPLLGGVKTPQSLGAGGTETANASIVAVPKLPSMVVNAPQSVSIKTNTAEMASISKGNTSKFREPVPEAQSILSKILHMMRQSSDKEPALYMPKLGGDWIRVVASDLDYEAKPYFKGKTAWGAAAAKQDNLAKWEELPFLGALLAKKGSGQISAFQEDHVWYGNKKTGKVMMMSIYFDHDKAEVDKAAFSGVGKKMAKSMVSKTVLDMAAANRNRFDFEAAGVRYNAQKVRSVTKRQRLGAGQAEMDEYKGKVSRYVLVHVYGTTPQEDVVALLSKLDVPKMRTIFE